MKILNFLENKKETWFLIFFGFLFFILRLPSIFEPYWYGDEGIYEVLGYGIRHGRLLYKTIWDNKPPILYWIYGIFDGNQLEVKALSLVFGLLALFAFFFLIKLLFKPKTKTVYLVGLSLFTLFFATPILEGNIANAENFMLFPIILSAFIIFSITTNNHRESTTYYKLLILAGILLGFSFLIKVVAVFDFGAFFLFLFLIHFENIKKIRNQIRELFYFSVGFFTPIVLIFIYFLLRGTLADFIKSAFFSNISYVNYGNQFIIPQGFLIIKLVLLLVLCTFIFIKRKSISQRDIFIILWFAFSLFSAFFSQRPYTHYLLVLLASSILFLCLILETKLNKWLLIVPFLLALFIVNNTFDSFSNVYKPTLGYYVNFLKFETGWENMDQYISFFDPNSLRDFQIAQYLNLNAGKNPSIFVWGNSAQIYKMANTLPPGRFTVEYHVTMSAQNLKETQSILMKNKPKFVVILQDKSQFPLSLLNYSEKIIIGNSYIYEKIF